MPGTNLKRWMAPIRKPESVPGTNLPRRTPPTNQIPHSPHTNNKKVGGTNQPESVPGTILPGTILPRAPFCLAEPRRQPKFPIHLKPTTKRWVAPISAYPNRCQAPICLAEPRRQPKFFIRPKPTRKRWVAPIRGNAGKRWVALIGGNAGKKGIWVSELGGGCRFREVGCFVPNAKIRPAGTLTR